MQGSRCYQINPFICRKYKGTSIILSVMQKPSFLCIASYFKGNDFLRGMKSAGATVYLLTSKRHEDKAWATDAIDEIFYVCLLNPSDAGDE